MADFDPVAPGTQLDRDLQYADGDRNAGTDPNVTGVAYRNSQSSAFGGTTELYDIDADILTAPADGAPVVVPAP